MDRAFSLPEMEIKAGSLVPTASDNLSHTLCLVLIEVAQGMDAWLRERRTPSEGPDDTGKVRRLQRILESLKPVEGKLDTIKVSRSLPDHQRGGNFLKGEWMAMEFTYYSVRSAILGLILAAGFDAGAHCARLDSARRALMALKSMQDNAWTHCTCSMAFASSLTCNVVITADLADLRLLKEVSDGFTVVSVNSPTICRIEEFCKRLVRLCFDTISKSKLPNGANLASFPQQPVTRQNSPQSPVQNSRGKSSRISNLAERSAGSPFAAAGPTGQKVPFDVGHVQDIEFFDIFDGAAEWLRLENNEEQFWQLFGSQTGGFAGGP
ncbi:hypothetical protein BKA56DRAFT_622233 [Ilyonectria sp. MPI-CAGE-AT-0026]|nr:hypothetical protein BKA56DRAFT_622233 [Ilyonectria sp. MPI-CAGE-AT-0026]